MPFALATSLRTWAFRHLGPRHLLRTTNNAFVCPRKTTLPRACNILMRVIIGYVSKWFTPAPFVLSTHCSTEDMVADCLTKPLASPAIRRFAGAMSGLRPIPHPPFGGPIGRIGHSLSNPHDYSLLSDVWSS